MATLLSILGLIAQYTPAVVAAVAAAVAAFKAHQVQGTTQAMSAKLDRLSRRS